MAGAKQAFMDELNDGDSKHAGLCRQHSERDEEEGTDTDDLEHARAGSY